MMVTTRIEPRILRELPDGFSLDSISEIDTLTGHSMSTYFPRSTEDQEWNERLQKRLKKEERAYYPDRPIEPYASSEYELWVSRYDAEKNRFTFMVQSYYSGAAHYNMDSLSFEGGE